MTRRRLLLLAAVVLVAASSCRGGGDDGATTTTDTRRPNQTVEGIPAQGRALDTVEKGKLTACVDVPKAPFAVDEEGKVGGIDPELLRGLGGRLGLQAEFRDVNATALFSELDQGRCDVAATAVPATAADATARLASEPYFDVTQALLVREEDASRYPDLAALRGRTVGAQAGSAGVATARSDPGVTVAERPDLADLVASLKAGRLDAVVHDYPLLAAAAKASPGTVVTKRFPDVTDRYVFVVRKDAVAAKAALDQALRAVRGDDTYNTVMRRYLGTTATPEAP